MITPSLPDGISLLPGYHSISPGITIALSNTCIYTLRLSLANLSLIFWHSINYSYLAYSYPVLVSISNPALIETGNLGSIFSSLGGRGLPSESTRGGSSPLIP